MNLQQRLLSVSRYATLEDFKVGLEFEEVVPYGAGHQFIPRSVSSKNFIQNARDYAMLVSQRRALVPVENVPSEDYEKAKQEIVQNPEYQRLMSEVPQESNTSSNDDSNSAKKASSKPKSKSKGVPSDRKVSPADKERVPRSKHKRPSSRGKDTN